nr:hypothetical protein [Providencia rettgeri]
MINEQKQGKSVKNNEETNNKLDKTEIEDKKKTKRQADAENKANLAKRYAEAGFKRAKIYLGKDTYKKLEEIYKIQQKNDLNFAGRKEIDSVSRVITYCINTAYNNMIKTKNEPYILPAVKPYSQQLYDLYQVAHFLKENGDSPIDILKKMQNEHYPTPNSLIKGGERYKQAPWTLEEVMDLLDIKALNLDIEYLNELSNRKKWSFIRIIPSPSV